jgi:hypothetical protein
VGVGAALALLGLGAAAASRTLLRPSPEEWVCREFCRTTEQAKKVRALENAFRASCPPECARACAAQSQIQALVMRSRSLTPELRSALEDAARARSAADAALLEHVYAVAAELPPDRREAYLRAVLPSLAECCTASPW